MPFPTFCSDVFNLGCSSERVVTSVRQTPDQTGAFTLGWAADPIPADCRGFVAHTEGKVAADRYCLTSSHSPRPGEGTIPTVGNALPGCFAALPLLQHRILCWQYERLWSQSISKGTHGLLRLPRQHLGDWDIVPQNFALIRL